jgi:Uma2 family endonuclease
MSVSIPSRKQSEIVYPESDGKPMAENTLQFQWIVTIKEGLARVFAAQPNVFIAGDLLWYPVEGRPDISAAPDAMVAIGRPQGYRGCYKQWEEGGIAPQVVFEVLSPNNRFPEMVRKLKFYERYGPLEYYLYDPDHNRLDGWQRKAGEFLEIPELHGWVSPTLGISFDTSGGELRILGPDGRPFLSYPELALENDQLAAERNRFASERDQIAGERDQIAGERDQIAGERDRLAAKLRALGVELPP